MEYTLSEGELEGLLQEPEGEVSSSGKNNLKQHTVSKRRGVHIRGVSSKLPKIKSYEFQRPDKFSKDHFNTIEVLFESFARSFAGGLSNLLRTFAALKVTSVSQVNYQELLNEIPNPTALCIYQIEPLKGSNLVVLDPDLAFLIVDRLFGGKGVPLGYNRELTSIEQSIIRDVFTLCLNNLEKAWSPLFPVKTKLENLEVNPQYAQIFPPGEITVKITVEMILGDTVGNLRFCIPYINLEPILSRFSMQNWYSVMRQTTVANELTQRVMVGNLRNIHLPVSVNVGSVNLSVEDVSKLKKGDLIRLYNFDYRKPLKLRVGNEEKFYCRVGLLGKRVGVKVLKEIKPS